MWGGWLGKVTRWLHCSQPPRVVLGACSHRNFWKFWCPEIVSGSCTYTVKTKGLFQFGYRSSQSSDDTIAELKQPFNIRACMHGF